MSLTLGTLEASDVAPLARLHRRAFPGFFLSSLGEPFLEEFYRGFLGDVTAVTVVARAAGTVRGAAVGTLAPAAFFARLLRRRWSGFAVASCRAVLARPAALPRLVQAVRYRGAAGGHVDGALLSSIFVDPAARAAGVGGALLEAWVDRARAGGAAQAYLTTDADGNDAVNSFYRRHGWSASDRFTTTRGRTMLRYTLALESSSR